LGVSLKRIFQRERESITTSSTKDTLVPVLSGATLAPEPEIRQPPPSPLSPGDGRLRSILKKTSTTISPGFSDQNESHLHEPENQMHSSDDSIASSPKPS
jgi:hypothetical protein